MANLIFEFSGTIFVLPSWNIPSLGKKTFELALLVFQDTNQQFWEGFIINSNTKQSHSHVYFLTSKSVNSGSPDTVPCDCDSRHTPHPERQSFLSGCRLLTGVITESSLNHSIFKLASLRHGS